MRVIARLGGSALAVLALACTSDPGRGTQPTPLDPKMVALGQQIYRARCATCHGAAGQGVPGWEKPDAAGELPSPPHDSTGHTWRHADGMLYRMVRDGWRDPFNKTDRLTMPPFGDVLSPQEIRAVITYLKTWWTPEQRQFQWEETRKDPFPRPAER